MFFSEINCKKSLITNTTLKTIHQLSCFVGHPVVVLTECQGTYKHYFTKYTKKVTLYILMIKLYNLIFLFVFKTVLN